MGLFHFLNNSTDINTGVETCKATQGAVLLDVRSAEEFAQGHVPHSINVPLPDIASLSLAKTSPLFVYCHSGARSRQACAWLNQNGYTATNLGGITSYRGTVEKGGNK